MPRALIPANSPPVGSYPVLPLSSGGADLMFTAVDDPVSRSTLLSNNKTLVLAYNVDAAPHTITFTSVADASRRTGDIVSYSVAAGHIAMFGPFATLGWAQSDGTLYIDVSDPRLRLTVIKLP